MIRAVLAAAAVAATLIGTAATAVAASSPADRLPATRQARDTPPSRECRPGSCTVPARYRDYDGFLAWTRDDLRATWTALFRRAHLPLTAPKVVIVSGEGTVASACSREPIGRDAAVGPIYCAGDGPGTVYLPTTSLQRIVFEGVPDFRLRNYATRDFAFSVVVAHEWAHHLQAALGRRDPVFRLRGPHIRVELQADCLAGVWARSAWRRALLDGTDIPEAVRVASNAGDRPGVAPGDPRAHGTGAQRRTWFSRGFDRGTVSSCDTRRVPLA